MTQGYDNYGSSEVLKSVAYLEFIKGGGATFDKLKRCNKAESLTEILVEVWMIF